MTYSSITMEEYNTKIVHMMMFFILFIQFVHTKSSPSAISCSETEWQALMEIKSSLVDGYGRLASWKGRDCCSWGGVTCNSQTGFVQSLELGSYFLEGRVNSSLMNLKHLEYLDLSFNHFEELPIPAFLGSLNNLQYLGLMGAGFSGENIPPQLGKLPNLQQLSLGGNENASFSVKSLNWIPGLSSLQSLELYQTNLSECVDWLDSVKNLSSISIRNCVLPSTKIADHSSLVYLELYHTSFGSTLPPWLFNLTRLEHLSLKYPTDDFQGPIPNSFETLTNLTTLDFSLDSLGSPYNLNANLQDSAFPDSLCRLTRLTHMFLTHANLQDSLPSCLSNLTSLKELHLNNNKLSGKIPGELGNLTQLTYLHLSRNHFTSSIPSEFGHLQNLTKLVITHNQLTGEIPFTLVNLTNLDMLDVTENFLTGTLSNAINIASVSKLQLSGNQISGNIPREICNMKDLVLLSLGENLLAGMIPSCLGNLRQLVVLDLANNELFGHIPTELGSLENLSLLHLNGNYLSGELSTSFQNLKRLTTLDLGENKLQGCIPKWMGKEFSMLQYLRLQSNNFSCEIPAHLCQFPSLHILNLANNNLVDTIPPCLGNLSMFLRDLSNRPSVVYDAYTDSLLNSIKGIDLEYSSSLRYSNFISLSGNHLHGEIPEELMNLKGLQSLNLSNNALVGRIPAKVGNMKSLESLDLSMNQFSGIIPQSLASIDALSYLNLSFNNLEGEIPSGNHFDTLGRPSNFEGNIGLCGKILNKSCSRLDDDDDSLHSSKEKGSDSEDNDGFFELSWLYAGAAPGFVIGLLGVIFILYFNKSWRYAYFRSLENAYDKVWVTLAIRLPRLARMLN